MKKILISVIFIIVTGSILFLIDHNFKSKEYYDLLETTETYTTGFIDKYYIYGKTLNIEGNIDKIKFEDIKLVFKNNEHEIEHDLLIDVKDRITFKTGLNINKGINLEKIDNEDYIIFLRIDGKYYNLVNKTEYNETKYYKIGNIDNRKSDCFTISFDQKNTINYMKMDYTKERELVYDIILDPGHGGNDPGGNHKGEEEKKYNLEYALELKNKLEEKGIRVKLTREEDKNIEIYGVGSRTGIPYESHAKLMLSMHLNATPKDLNKIKGFEIYTAYNDDYDFSKYLINQMLEKTNSVCSNNPYNKVEECLYTKTYSKSDVKSLEKDAKKYKFELNKNITTNTTYYYFIRETGGFMTYAHTDGNNKNHYYNPYYNSNIGVEAYLLELAYITNKEDLNKIKNDKDLYIEALVNSIEYYLDN